MLRDEDEYDDGIECPVCHRSVSTYARLDDHMREHESLPRCGTCGVVIRGFHKH